MNPTSFFPGALRVAALARRNCASRSLPHLLTPARSVSFSPCLSSLNRRPTSLTWNARRSFSLRSLLPGGGKTPDPTPPPGTLGAIEDVEREANAHPHSLEKQLGLFRALVETGMKEAYSVLVARWETMCEFDPKSPLLRSDEAFQLYITSLVKLGLQPSVSAAVHRRESLLASAPAASTSLLENAPDDATAAPTPSAANNAAPPSNASLSQTIADAVLSSGGASSATGAAQGVSPTPTTSFGAAAGGNSANPVHVVVHETKGSWVPTLVRFVVLTMVGAFFLLVVAAVLLEQSGLLKVGPQQSQFEPTPGKTVKFSDVHGVDEAKEELQDVVEFLKNPGTFMALGGKMPKGVLLTGRPGTGKTLLARAVAGEAGVPFFSASGSEFDEMFVGVGAKRVRELFQKARSKQPAIIFIDEMDAVGGKRSARDHHYMKQTLNQLLVEMDGFSQSEGVIVIAATNFPEALDPALVRPGRFDRIVAVPLPDIKGRMQILQHHMLGITSAKDADTSRLARGTGGFSGADLQNLVNLAAIQASKEHAKEVSLKHFEWARDRILMGAERRSSVMEDSVKRATAYHEGGHALTAIYTAGATPLHKVTCMPRGHSLGHTSFLPKNDMWSVSLKEYQASIDVSLGGRVAEELVYGREGMSSGSSADIRAATSTASAMVKEFGFSNKVGPVHHDSDMSSEKHYEIESEIRRLIVEGEARVTALLKEKEQELHRLADALMDHETLDAEEVDKVIKGEPIRNIQDILREQSLNVQPQAPAPTPAPAQAQAQTSS